MAVVSLLQIGTTPTQKATFAFEHAMAHRNYLGIMAPLTRFSVIPYLLDPMASINPAGAWHQSHQQAHDDALTTVPTAWGAKTVGLFVGRNLRDTDLRNREQKTWWTFQNHMEHYIANGTTLPVTGTRWRWPFW